MPKERAHNLQEKARTDDVIVDDDINFKDLLLSNSTIKGLERSGFKKPSPIQRKAIPLGRCGFDLFVQAKSGTGKTCVFTVVALEMLKPELDRLQVLILSPTREISVQIKDVISTIGQGVKNLNVQAFIGGLPLESDKKNLQKCQIAVGAPGRVKHLIDIGLMKVDAVRLFVLDEADKLMEESFRTDVGHIFLTLPEAKQVIASSATFPPVLNEFITRFMSNPVRVSLHRGIFLKGIRQFVSIVPSHLNILQQMTHKCEELTRILSNISFKQCLIFSNYQSRAESLCSQLTKLGWPAVHINGTQSQTTRLKMMSDLKEFRCRVFISTDLTARGIDAENVNLVVNMDLPYDGATYMHRIGRAGRYGSHGIAVTIVQDGSECDEFKKMLNDIGGKDFQVSILPQGKMNFDIWKMKENVFDKVTAIDGEYKGISKRERGHSCEAIGETNGEKKANEVSNVLENSKEKSKTSTEAETNSEVINFNIIEKLIIGKKKPKENPKSFQEILELSNEFEKNGKSNIKLKSLGESFDFEKFPRDIISAVSFIEEVGWKKFKAKVEGEKPKENDHVVLHERNLVHEKADEENEDTVLGDSREESICQVEPKTELDKSEEESSLEDVENADEAVSDETESDTEGHEGDESEDEYMEHFHSNWYGTWYSQLSTVRQYVNFVKAFNSGRVLSYWR
ncbi:hypothetical protein RUM44_004859 [Polyplax serrata]|uniref:RNA helicase n=1 Tax=Polyplax serrata TaxID=468196 RepID=A0ABR1B5S2_POLSC